MSTKRSIISCLRSLAIKQAAARPYTYSQGVYTFSNVGDKVQALQDIEDRYNALLNSWKKTKPEEKKLNKERYNTKMRALAEEKNRLAKNYGDTWRYKYNARSGKIEAYRELKNIDQVSGNSPILDAPHGVQEVIKVK